MDNLTVKNFTNIDEEDFEGMYMAQAISLRRGQTKAFPEECARHLAGQLATKILIRKQKDYLLDPERETLLNEMLGEITAPEEEPIIPEEGNPRIMNEEEEKEFEELKVKKPQKRAKK